MGLPTSRDLNYSPGATAIPAVNMNNIQDVLVALNNLVTGLAQGFWTGVTLAGNLTVVGSITGKVVRTWVKPFWPKLIVPGSWSGALTGGNQPYILSAAGVNTGIFEIPCEEGHTITGLTFEAFGDGTVDTTAIANYATSMTGFATPTTLSTVTDSNRAAAWGVVTMPAFSSQLIGAGGSLYLSVTANAANYRIGVCHASFAIV